MELTQTRYEIERGVATVILHRPDKMNALTSTMQKELVEIFGAADRDDSVRAVVVTGAGKSFCAGADLSSGGSAFDRRVQEGRDHEGGGDAGGGPLRPADILAAMRAALPKGGRS